MLQRSRRQSRTHSVAAVQRDPLARPTLRWGLWDFVLAWISGLVAAVFASSLVVGASDPVRLVVVLVAQDTGVVAYLAWSARRKGLGSLRDDYGLQLVARDWAWLLVGVGLQALLLPPTALLAALYGSRPEQEVVAIADQAQGAQIPLMVVAVVFVAPVVEELLFRGALLRALLRRTKPTVAVALSAAVFGLIHVVGDPSVGSLLALPAIVVLGLALGTEAVRTGRLSRSILMHVGFNALTVALLFA